MCEHSQVDNDTNCIKEQLMDLCLLQIQSCDIGVVSMSMCAYLQGATLLIECMVCSDLVEEYIG